MRQVCDIYGIPVVNKRISVSPMAVVGAPFSPREMVQAAQSLDEAARLIPVPGKKAGDRAYFGGLLGEATIIPVPGTGGSAGFINMGGRIPAPLQSLGN